MRLQGKRPVCGGVCVHGGGGWGFAGRLGVVKVGVHDGGEMIWCLLGAVMVMARC